MMRITGLLTVLALGVGVQSCVADEIVRLPLTRRILTHPVPTINDDGTINSVANQRTYFPGTLRALSNRNTSQLSNETMLVSSLASGESQRESMNNYFTLVYTAELWIGTPGRPFNLVFDTGSSDLWVINKNNRYGELDFIHYYDPSDSSSLKNVKSQGSFLVSYGSGDVSGQNAQETVTLLGKKALDCWFGLVYDFTPQFRNSIEPMDGILGLGYQSIHGSGNGPNIWKNYNDQQYDTVMDALKTSGSIVNRTFSFILAPSEDSSDPSMFILGGIPDDIAKQYAPQGFVNVPVQQYKSNYGYWYVPMQSMSIGGINSPSSCSPSSPCLSMLDTGTSLIAAPDAVFKQFWNTISSYRSDCYLMQGVQVWCTDFTYNNLPLMTVSFGGSSFVIYPADYTIVNGDRLMLGLTSIGLNFPNCPTQYKCFIFGDVFLKQHYTVFDMETNSVSIANDYPRQRPSKPEPRETKKSNTWLYILVAVSVVCGLIGMFFLYRIWRKRQAYLQNEGLLQNAANAGVPDNRVPLSQRSGGYRLGGSTPTPSIDPTPVRPGADRQRPLLSDDTELSRY